MDAKERARLRALCEAATPGPECTGITAMWCPRCGDCTCPGDPDRGDPMDDPRCPLHAANSPHGEGEHEDKVAAVATLASWRKLIVDTAAALGQTMPPCVWYDHGNLARLAADVVRERDEARARVAALETALRELAESHRSSDRWNPQWCKHCGVTWGTQHIADCPVGRALRVLDRGAT